MPFFDPQPGRGTQAACDLPGDFAVLRRLKLRREELVPLQLRQAKRSESTGEPESMGWSCFFCFTFFGGWLVCSFRPPKMVVFLSFFVLSALLFLEVGPPPDLAQRVSLGFPTQTKKRAPSKETPKWFPLNLEEPELSAFSTCCASYHQMRSCHLRVGPTR